MPRSAFAVPLLLLLGGVSVPPPSDAQTADAALDRKFTQTVKPFLAKYCIGCHGGASPAAMFTLQPYSNMKSVVDDFGHWAIILGRLTANEMPPKVAPQPQAAERQAVVDWVNAVRSSEAKKYAGDPGPVLVRRLSNSEYDNSIRDLTGVDLHPTREFPVDPANTSGFDNSGESLTMSPALLNKYLQAARDVADHMVLTPDGIDFAPHLMLAETDREKYAIMRIVNFYLSQPTDYADYFQAAWRYKHRAALGKPNMTLAAAAAEGKVSPKYLPMIWGLIEEPAEKQKAEVGPIAKLQTMWKALPTPAENKPEELRAKTVEMRDFIKRIRLHTSMQFMAPVIRGLPTAAQPVLTWKYKKYNTHRRNSDSAALRNDTDPEPEVPAIPRYPGLHQEAGIRWAALMAKARAGDKDLIVPKAERAKYEESFARFANVFPDEFFVKERGRYFPDDSDDKGRLLSSGVHNVMGYWRDDVPLQELILDEKGIKYLDRLWDEFDYIGDHSARTWDQYYFNQAGAVDGRGAESGRARPTDHKVSDPEIIFGLRDDHIRKAGPENTEAIAAVTAHFQWVNDTLRHVEKERADAPPLHLESLVKFAGRAYRRPLTPAEKDDLLGYYKTIRDAKGSALSHEDAIRDCIVRVLMSPKFSYRVDLVDSNRANRPLLAAAKPAAAAGPVATTPLSPYAMASRLSYFIWSSIPDEELLKHAAAGDLSKPEVLVAQARRMLKDPRARGLAVDFGGNWLDFRHFEQHNAVDRERFPQFTNDLRTAMFEEPVRYIEDVLRSDRSVLELLYGKYTFVNPVLAKHYGMPEVKGGNDTWVKVDNAAEYGRGGLLSMSVFLTQNAPGLRTSPVKRGYWVVKRVLGEQIPPPPPVVPELPNDEAKADLPVRDALKKHREVAMCAACHAKFDSFGLVFEGYGAVGERRTKDMAGRDVDTQATFPNGVTGNGLEAVQQYIREKRQKDFLDNISRKLVSYALGRSLMLSDEPLIEKMQARLTANGNRFSALVESLVTSPQFLNKRTPTPQEQKGE